MQATTTTNNLEEIFLEAIEEHKERLYRICTSYASDSEQAKDLFQEVLIHIWRSLPSFKSESVIGTWMYRVTINVCLRLQSTDQKRRIHFKTYDSIKLESVPDIEIDQEQAHQLKLLQLCIQRLRDTDKSIITLYLEELPYKDISEITGLSENHIAVKIKRIKQKLLTCINEQS